MGFTVLSEDQVAGGSWNQTPNHYLGRRGWVSGSLFSARQSCPTAAEMYNKPLIFIKFCMRS